MEVNSAQLLMLLQWIDSAFPTGSFAHSGGLETYVQFEQVQDAKDLAALISTKLESAAHTDLIVVHHAMSAFVARDVGQIAYLDELCSASKLARKSREASEKIGRRMLASVLNLVNDDLLRVYHDGIATGRFIGHHAVVHGLACAAMDIEAKTALLGYAYALAANQTAASVKLMSIGQTQAQAVLGSLHHQMDMNVDAALASTLDDFGSFIFGLDIRSTQHEYLFRRLFIS